MSGAFLPFSHLPSGLRQAFLAALLIFTQNSGGTCTTHPCEGTLPCSWTPPEYHLGGNS